MESGSSNGLRKNDERVSRKQGMEVALKRLVICTAACALLAVCGGWRAGWAQSNELQPPGFSAMGAETPDLNDGGGNALPIPVPAPGEETSPGLSLPPEATFGGGGGSETGGMGEVVPKTPEELEAEIRQDAFHAAVSGLLPLRPAEIRQLLEYYDQTQEAVEVPVYPYPKPEVSVITLSLDPGVVPPVIKVATGHVTTLSLLDVTGAPWPIQDVSWAGNFEVVQPEEGGHVIRITPMSEFTYGNMSLRLITLKTPITFTLQTQRDTVQYRVDARVPQYGPFASSPLIEGGISTVAGDADITAILDGAPPSGAVRLTVSGVDGRTSAWRFNGRTYVRTPLTLLSPGWDASVRSVDGMSVYALANAPVLLLSDQGRVMRAHVDQEGISDGR